MRRRRFGWLVAVMAVLGWAPGSAAQAPPPGAVVDVVSPSLAPCTTGMRVVGFDHAPDGLPVVAWTEDCGSDGTTAAFWTRGAVRGGGWSPRPFQSERRFDHDHRLIVMPGDGAPLLLFSSIGNVNETNTYRINLDTTLVPGSASTYLENIALPQSCLRPAYSAASSPSGTAGAGLQWATAITSCNGYGRVRVNGADLMTADAGGPKAALAVTPGGAVHVLWRTDAGLFHARRAAGAAWTTTTLPGAARETALVADAAGVLHALVTGWAPDHAGDLGSLVYFRSADDGLTWTPPQIVDPWDAVPANPGIHTDIALAVDAQGVPAVAYWKGRRQLWYAKRDGPGPSWNGAQVGTHTLDAPRAVGLDFDQRNQPVLVYFDQPNNRLVAARTVPPLPAATTTSLRASSSSITVGQPVHLEATVTSADPAAGTPDGAVLFSNATLGGATTRVLLTEGSAPWTIDSLPTGTHTLRAAYEGTDDYAPSTGTVTVTVSPAGTPPAIRPLPDRIDLLGTLNVLIPIEVDGAGVVTVDGLPPGATYVEDEDRRIVAPVVRYAALGVHRVTVTIANAAGSASTSFTWTIRDNTPPFIYPPGDQRSLAGRPVELRIRTLEPDNDPLTITNAALPPGITATMDRSDLVLAGTVTQLATFNVSLRVFDGFASFDRQFTWTFLPWADLEVTSELSVVPAYAGDAGTRGLLLVAARQLAGTPMTFTTPEVVGYDIDLPPGAVFAGVEGTRTPDGARALGSCSGRSGRIRCWQAIDGVGAASTPIELWMNIHLLLPAAPAVHVARVQATLPLGLDPEPANDLVEARAQGEVRAATGRRAIVIVMENNETQRTSFTYQGLRASLQAALPTIDLAAAGVPPAVLALADATGGPLLEAVRTQLAAGVGAMNQALTNYLITQRGGVGGCFTDMLMTLRDDPSRSHEHPYLGYIDQYGEVAIAECLREIATPYYDRVEVLTDSEATFANFKWTVEQLHQQGYTMDLLLDVHGCGLPQTRNNVICDTVPSLRFADGNAYLDGEVQQNGEPLGPTLRSLNSFFNGTSGFLDAQGAFVAAAESGYVRLNNVYMVACWGSNFNEMWLDMGASASNGAEELNYFVLSSPFTFLDQFTRNGAPLDEAARRAYEEERVLFEGLPTPVTLDFRWIPGCGACVYPVDVSAVYRRRLALALGDLYGEDEHQPVEPVPSSRRVGMQRQRLEPGTTEIVMGDSLGRPLLGLRPTTVTSGGTVTLATSAVGPELGIHQSLGTSDLQYDIAVSAVLEGATEVCLTWNEGRFQQEAGVRLLHFEGGAWQDHTTSLDTDANVVCATVTSFSPFAMVEFVNRAPIATAGPDRQVEASGPGGATVALDGAASTDPDGDALTFRWTWAGGQADGPAPSITLPVGTHAVTLTVTDAFGAASTATLSIAVVPPALTGRMLGHGRLDDPDTRYTFAFTVTRKSDGTASGEVALKVYPRATQKPARPEAARFTADAVTSVAFFADDTLGAGPGASGQAPGRGERRPEAVAFSGSGRWNGVPGHRVDARATAGRDKAGTGATVALTITAPDGTVVASVSGEVQDGRIVATGGPPASR